MMFENEMGNFSHLVESAMFAHGENYGASRALPGLVKVEFVCSNFMPFEP